MKRNPFLNPDLFLFARDDWKKRSHFHELSEAEVLKQVSERIGRHQKPVVLLDLDSTLYEVGPRTHAILTEWLSHSDSNKHPEVRERLKKLEEQHVGFSLRDTFGAIGLSQDDPLVERAMIEAKDFWSNRFFTSGYLSYDRAYPGASQFVNKIYNLGAHLVYLTGRDLPNMGHGTESNLIRDGFPWKVERTHLLLKPHRSMSDLEHKKSAADFVRRTGNLVASFENEPLNLVALGDLFPDAMHVFVETVCSDHPANPGKNLYRIRGFSG
ncbi:MAG: HAD family hydrolase [Bdellovibrionota bacterium]